MLLLDFWPLVRFKAGQAGRLFVEKIPFFALSAGASVVTFVIQRSSGAMESGEKFAFGARLANALISYCRYLGKVFWPTDLALPYPYPGHWPLEQELLAGGLMAGLSVALLLGRQRFPFSLMGWLWFCGTLVPVIGLVQVGSQAMADRYTYLPSIGLFVMLVWGGRELVRRSGIVAVALSSAAVAAVLLAGELTHQQLAYWRDSVTLFTRTLAVTKDNYAAHNNLGTALDDNGMPAAAIREFQEARRLEPDDVAAYNNLGAAFTLKGEVDAAIDQYRQALLVQPDNATARANLGNALYGKGEIDAAMNQFQELLRRHPEHAQAHFNLGVILGQKGQLDQAISQLEEAFRLRPDYAEAHFNLALALAQKGLTSAAIAQYEEALRIKPDYAEAHNNLGSALGRMGLLDGAISEFREAVRLQPGYDQARENLAQALSVRNSPADH